jgi:hypothetical protein
MFLTFVFAYFGSKVEQGVFSGVEEQCCGVGGKIWQLSSN